MDETKDYFRRTGTVASWWHPESPDDPLYEHSLEQLQWASTARPWQGQTVLDIATGRGRFAIAYALGGAHVTAADISRDMLIHTRANAEAQNARLDLILSDAERLPFPDHCFDEISCMEAIMHFPNTPATLAEFRRLLKPGGHLLLSITNRYRINALNKLPMAIYQKLGLISSDGPRIMWHYSLPAFAELLKETGFEIEHAHGQGLFQPNARIYLRKDLSFRPFPQSFAHWFFENVEPSLRQTPLKNIMGTINLIVQPRK